MHGQSRLCSRPCTRTWESRVGSSSASPVPANQTDTSRRFVRFLLEAVRLVVCHSHSSRLRCLAEVECSAAVTVEAVLPPRTCLQRTRQQFVQRTHLEPISVGSSTIAMCSESSPESCSRVH